MKEQKCSQCKTWNTNEKRCTNCNAPLVAAEVNKDYRALIDAEDAQKPVTKAELLFGKMKDSPNVLVRGLYYVLFSISTVYFVLVSFTLYMVAAMPG
jgi:hypothetical protein